MILISLSGFGYLHFQHNNLSKEAFDYQSKIAIEKTKEPDPNADYQYDSNSALTSFNQLKNNRKLDGVLTLRGYLSMPTQNGAANPIYTIPIYEGSTDKTLAYGAGTSKPNQVFGQNNFTLSAHNFADQKTFFSPLQIVDVAQSPLVYLFDGNNIYAYQLTDKQIVNFKQGDVLNDNGSNKITLVTCDEPNSNLDLNPDNRIIISGPLLSIQSFSDADKNIQNLFSNN